MIELFYNQSKNYELFVDFQLKLNLINKNLQSMHYLSFNKSLMIIIFLVLVLVLVLK